MESSLSHHTHPNYLKVYIWLLILTVGSILLSRFLHPYHLFLIFVVFTIAGIKALLVALNFMHLRYEGKLILGCALVPLILFAIVLFVFMPDLLSTVKR